MQELLTKLIEVLGSSAGVALTVSLLRTYVMPRIPRAVVPLVAYALGAVAEYLLSLATGTVDPVRGALIMMGAGHLREWITTIQQHGVTGR